MFRLICQPSILSEMGKRLIFVLFFSSLVAVLLYAYSGKNHTQKPTPPLASHWSIACVRQGIATSLVLGDLRVGFLFDPYWRQILEAALWPIGMLVMGLVLSTLWAMWAMLLMGVCGSCIDDMAMDGVSWKLYNFLRCIVSEPLFLPNGLGGTKWLGEEHEDDGWLVRRLVEVFFQPCCQPRRISSKMLKSDLKSNFDLVQMLNF